MTLPRYVERFFLFMAGVTGLAASSYADESRNLFQNGFAASSYGDITLDKGTLRDEETSALRLKAGVQLFNLGPVGFSLGYQKVGFYTTTHSWKRDSGFLRYDYRGPVAELHFFPQAIVNLSLAASVNSGYSLRAESDPSRFDFTCPAASLAETSCTVLQERSALHVNEYTAQLGLRVAPQLQLTLGFGKRDFEGKDVAFQTSASKNTGQVYVANPSSAWKEKGSFMLFGLRGSTL